MLTTPHSLEALPSPVKRYLRYVLGENHSLIKSVHIEQTGVLRTNPTRWGTFGNEFKQVAWEGHFRDYHWIEGILIPHFGEVGWYHLQKWEPVWRGEIIARRI